MGAKRCISNGIGLYEASGAQFARTNTYTLLSHYVSLKLGVGDEGDDNRVATKSPPLVSGRQTISVAELVVVVLVSVAWLTCAAVGQPTHKYTVAATVAAEINERLCLCLSKGEMQYG